MELKIDRVTKHYKNKIAVDRISFNIQPGIYGLLGENGAGKSTLMRMICGILRPDSGSIMLDGADVATEEYREGLGYLPQEFGYYPDFTAEDFLLYMAALKGLAKGEARQRAKELLELVGLKEAARKKLKTFSGGMKQRVGIAQALLNHPRVLILDEPTAGLDPRERVRFHNLLKQMKQEAIVILSTHIVTDVERIANHILMIRQGQLIFSGTREKAPKDLEKFYLENFSDAEEVYDE